MTVIVMERYHKTFTHEIYRIKIEKIQFFFLVQNTPGKKRGKKINDRIQKEKEGEKLENSIQKST